MKVVLVYDARAGSPPPRDDLPEDFDAEYDDEATIQALLGAIEACGHEALGLALGESFVHDIRRLAPGIVFNIAEGVRGTSRESIVPAWLDHLGIPYTGSDGLTLAVSLDKALTKTLLAARGLRTPAFRRVRDESELEGMELEFPLFVKPNGEGSSMGVRVSSLVRSTEELKCQVGWILRTYRQDCLVEEFAPGREFCVGILGNEEPQALPIVEIRSAGSFYSYEHKLRHQKELICPAELPPDAASEMLEVGLETYRALRCRDFARVDLKLDAEDRSTLLEINPLPGLSPTYSIFTCQALAGGLAYEELIGRIIELAVRRSQV